MNARKKKIRFLKNVVTKLKNSHKTHWFSLFDGKIFLIDIIKQKHI